jgi:hypothetical protein
MNREREIYFRPGQLIDSGTLSERLHDITLFSPQYEDGKTINEGSCVVIHNVSVPDRQDFRYNNNNNNNYIPGRQRLPRRNGQTVEGKIAKFLYFIERNGDVREVYGIKLTNGHEIATEDLSYVHQSTTDFSDVEVVPCNNMNMDGGKKRQNYRKTKKNKRTVRRYKKTKKTLRRR